uniref:PNPLA domain-containing protein n=1 Tax=viral metagenome TaxID=1070528 RepID=A0A6C0BP32_9ZZZZ
MSLKKFLTLSGGGINGILQLGALKYLQMYSQLLGRPFRFEGVAGTSIGSLIALLLACGYTVDEMLRIFMQHYKFISTINMSVQVFSSKHALQEARDLEIIVEGLIAQKFQCLDLTFAELYARTGTDLVVCAVNLNTCQTRLFSHARTPHTSVLQATMASMAIPFVFPAVEIDGHMYVDGGCMMNYPWPAFPVKDTLGLCILQKRQQAQHMDLKHLMKQTLQAVFFAQDEVLLQRDDLNLIILPATCPVIPLNPEEYDVAVNACIGGLCASRQWHFDPLIFAWFVFYLANLNVEKTATNAARHHKHSPSVGHSRHSP